jgi:branched-chain amino acid transport system substrate-binding protein
MKVFRTGIGMPGRRAVAAASVTALALGVAACGGSSSSSSSSGASASSGSGGKKCSASIGIEAPITGQVAQLGGEQLHFAQFAIDKYNQDHGTEFKLVQGDTQLTPAQATTVTQQFISNDKIVAMLGPAGSQEVSAIGPLAKRADLTMISGSATSADLTDGGKYPTFFRVVPRDDVQGPTDAKHIIDALHAKHVMVVDDQTSYSTGLAGAVEPLLKQAGVQVDHESVNQKQTDFSSIVSKVTPSIDVVFLPWQVATNTEQFGQNLREQGKKAVIVATDGSYSPDQFKTPGSYVSSFAPDIAAIPEDASIAEKVKAKYGSFGTYGPPLYAAATVAASAIDAVCKSGQTPSRSNVLEQVKKTNQPSSILGQPMRFDAKGDLVGAKFFIFKVGADGKYSLVTQS